jgi:hypothetical protein
MSLTFKGLKSTMVGAIKDLRAEFGAGFLDQSKLIVNDIIEGAKALKKYAGEAGKDFGDEMMYARAVLLSGFDVALKIAGQIREAMKYEGGIGTVILRSLQLGADLLGKAVLAAFKASISLWKTIGMILGQGVLDAIMRSGIPGSDMIRGIAIRRNLSQMSASDLRKLAIAEGYNVKFQAPVMEMKTVGFGATYKQTGVRAKTAAELAKDISGEISKLSIEQQLAYAQYDPAKYIEESYQKAGQTLINEMKDFGKDALEAIQNFANEVANISGQEPVNVMQEYQAAFERHMTEGEQIIEKWRSKLDPEETAPVKEIQQTAKATEMLTDKQKDARQTIDDMFRALEEEKQIIGMVNESRMRGRDIIELERLAREANISSVEELKSRYKETLKELREAEKLRTIADGIGDAFGRAFEDMAFGAKKASEAIGDLAMEVARLVMRQTITQPLAWAISDYFYGMMNPAAMNASNVRFQESLSASNIYMGSALGNVFNRGRIVPFAYGGIINYPTMFPMSGGQTGLMGENGPEAVMPLRRTSRGRLGVETAGGSNIPVVNVSVQVNNEAGKPIKPEDINISIDFVEAVGQAWVQNYNQNGIVRRTVKGQM